MPVRQISPEQIVVTTCIHELLTNCIDKVVESMHCKEGIILWQHIITKANCVDELY